MEKQPRRSEPNRLPLTEFLLLLATDEKVSNAFRESRESARAVMHSNGLTEVELQDVVLTGNSATVMGSVITEIRKARKAHHGREGGDGHEPPEITHALLLNLTPPPKK